MTTRGFTEKDFIEVANIITECLKNKDNEEIKNKLKKQVLELTNKYPVI